MDSGDETTLIHKKRRIQNGSTQGYADLPVIPFTSEERARIDDHLRRPFAPEYVKIRDNGSGGITQKPKTNQNLRSKFIIEMVDHTNMIDRY